MLDWPTSCFKYMYLSKKVWRNTVVRCIHWLQVYYQSVNLLSTTCWQKRIISSNFVNQNHERQFQDTHTWWCILINTYLNWCHLPQFHLLTLFFLIIFLDVPLRICSDPIMWHPHLLAPVILTAMQKSFGSFTPGFSFGLFFLPSDAKFLLFLVMRLGKGQNLIAKLPFYTLVLQQTYKPKTMFIQMIQRAKMIVCKWTAFLEIYR